MSIRNYTEQLLETHPNQCPLPPCKYWPLTQMGKKHTYVCIGFKICTIQKYNHNWEFKNGISFENINLKAILKYGDGGQLISVANLCLEAV